MVQFDCSSAPALCTVDRQLAKPIRRVARVTDQAFTFKLPDGSSIDVDARTYAAIFKLQSTIELLAAGQLSNLGLIEVNKEGKERAFMLIVDGEHLEILHREMIEQGSMALDLAKSWRGNVSALCLSYRKH